MSWRSYDADARGTFPTHMFEWAVGDVVDPHIVASKTLHESRTSHRRSLTENVSAADSLLEATGYDVADALVDAGFVAEVTVGDRGVSVLFEDDDGVVSSRRRDVAKRVMTNINDNRIITDMTLDENGMGRVDIRLARRSGLTRAKAVRLPKHRSTFRVL